MGALLALAAVLGAAVQEPSDLDLLMRRLASSEIADRDDAVRRLVAIGKRARPALEKVALEGAPETAALAKRALGQIDRLPECLVDSLSRAVRDHGTDYQRLLRDLSHWMKETCAGRDWAPFEAALAAAGCPRTEMGRHFAGPKELQRREARFRYVLLKDGFATPGGLKHDLYGEFEIRILVDPARRTRKEIWDFELGLHAKVGLPLKAAVAKDFYPKDSVLDRFLKKEDGFGESSKLAMLDSLEISYGLIFNRWVEIHPRGFHIEITTLSEDGKQGYASRFTVPSGLDPLEDRDGNRVTEGFKSENTLGEIGGKLGIGGHGWGGPGHSPRTSWVFIRKGEPDPPPESCDVPYDGATAYSVPDLQALAEATKKLVIDMPEMRDEELAHAERITGLHDLSLSHCEKLTGRGLAHVAKIAGLVSITLAGENLEDEGLKHLIQLPKLRRISVWDAEKLTSAGFGRFGRIRTLSHLHVQGCPKLTDACLEALASLPDLKSLDVSGKYDHAGDWGLKPMEKLAALERLEVWYPGRAGAADLAAVARMPALRTLEIWSAPLADATLGELAASKTIQSLQLGYAKQITGAGLASLLKMPDLKILRIYSCDKITEAEMKSALESTRGEFRVQ
jgi:hypothetical protein